jgi:hypothetical protein
MLPPGLSQNSQPQQRRELSAEAPAPDAVSQGSGNLVASALSFQDLQNSPERIRRRRQFRFCVFENWRCLWCVRAWAAGQSQNYLGSASTVLPPFLITSNIAWPDPPGDDWLFTLRQ